jgi:WD40 repeat protein
MFDIKQTRLAYDYGEIDAEQVNVLTVDKKNGRMYTAGQTSVKVWDIKARSMVSEIEGLCEKQITSMAITAGSKYLLVGSYDRRLTKIALETGTVEKVIDESHPGGVMAILTTTDGESVFTSGAR